MSNEMTFDLGLYIWLAGSPRHCLHHVPTSLLYVSVQGQMFSSFSVK